MKIFSMLLHISLIIFHTWDKFVAAQNLNLDIFINESQHDVYQNAVIDCIVSTSLKHIPCGTQFTLVHSTYFIDGVNILLNNKSCYSFLSRSFEVMEWWTWTDVYIFFTKNYHEIYVSLTVLSKDIFWNPRAHFFVIVNDLHKSEYLNVFNMLLNLNILNILLITKSNGKFNALTFHPFDEGICARSIYKIEEINDCTNIHSIKMNYTHLEHSLQNCTMNVVAIEDVPNVTLKPKKGDTFFSTNEVGIEQYILDNIAQQENLTMKYIYFDLNQEHGVVLPNLTMTGVLGYLHNNSADIAIGGYTLLENRVRLLEFFSGYSKSSLCIFAPTLGEEKWKRVYQGFDIGTWFLIGLSFIFATIVIMITRRIFLGDEDRKIIILKIWGYLYGQTDVGLIKSKKTQKIVMFWIWFTFFITSFYNSALCSLLTRNIEVNLEIDTTSLFDLPLEPCIAKPIRFLYKFLFNETLPKNTNSGCKSHYEALDTVANNTNYYCLEMDYTYYMREPYYKDVNGKSKLNILHITNDLMFAMYTARGFPLHDKFQRYTTYHAESGLLKRQQSLIYHQYVTPSKHHKKIFTTFRLSDFRIHFALLIIGYIISFICFTVELTLNKISQKSPKSNNCFLTSIKQLYK